MTDRCVIIPASRLYYQSVLPAVKAALLHTDADYVVLTIEDDRDAFAAAVGWLPDCVRTVNAAALRDQYFPPGGPNLRTPYVYLCLLRCAYADIFPDLGRVVAMDADAFFIRDCCGTDTDDPWTLDLHGAYLAGVPEPRLSAERGRPYVSAGVLLMDLDRIREDGLHRRMCRALRRQAYQWVEQDCLNEYCGAAEGGIVSLGNEWNSSQFTGIAEADVMRIRHFAYEHSWKHSAVYQAYDALTWDEVEDARKHRKEQKGRSV